MADPTRAQETLPATNVGAPPPPLWVKRFGLVALVLAIVFAVIHLTGRGHRIHSHDADGSGSNGGGP